MVPGKKRKCSGAFENRNLRVYTEQRKGTSSEAPFLYTLFIMETGKIMLFWNSEIFITSIRPVFIWRLY